MSGTESETTARQLRHEQIGRYWAGDLARRTYLFRKQRKAILENCRRIAVVGASADSNSPIFISIEKLLGMGLEIIPVFPGRESFLCLRFFSQLNHLPGPLYRVGIGSRRDRQRGGSRA